MKTYTGILFRFSYRASLYPTFKEWKLITIDPLDCQKPRLYPTFKEWKREMVRLTG